MAKVTLTDIVSGYKASETINTNNTAIEAAVENTLSRDGTTPNQMDANLDMNSNRILNLPNAVANQEPVTLAQAASIAGVTNPLSQDIIAGYLYPRTTAEIAASITPNQYEYPELDVRRYYSGTGVHTTAIQAAVNVGAQIGATGYLPAAMGEVTIDAPITITASRSGLIGDGQGLSRILCDACGAFCIAAGLSFNTISGMSIAQGVRYSTTPNVHVAISINGTTASQCAYSTYKDLFIDGFHTPLAANAVVENLFHNIRTVYSKHGITSTGVSIISTISDCWFVGCADATGYGANLGDGVLDQEGWVVHDTTFFDFLVQIRFYCVLSSWVTNCTLDATGTTGILQQSSATAPAINNVFRNNYIGFKATATGSAGIQLANAHAASDPQNSGTIVDGNEILQYSGAGTLQYGIIADGTYEKKGIYINNRIRDAATADIRLEATATEAIIDNNQCYGAGYSFATGANPAFGSNNRGTMITVLAPSIASAAEVTLPTGPTVFTISGTTTITSIVATGHHGKTITLIFDGSLTFTDGSNLLLAGNFVTSSNDSITLYCNGTNFIEFCRSVN